MGALQMALCAIWIQTFREHFIWVRRTAKPHGMETNYYLETSLILCCHQLIGIHSKHQLATGNHN